MVTIPATQATPGEPAPPGSHSQEATPLCLSEPLLTSHPHLQSEPCDPEQPQPGRASQVRSSNPNENVRATKNEATPPGACEP